MIPEDDAGRGERGQIEAGAVQDGDLVGVTAGLDEEVVAGAGGVVTGGTGVGRRRAARIPGPIRVVADERVLPVAEAAFDVIGVRIRIDVDSAAGAEAGVRRTAVGAVAQVDTAEGFTANWSLDRADDADAAGSRLTHIDGQVTRTRIVAIAANLYQVAHAGDDAKFDGRLRSGTGRTVVVVVGQLNRRRAGTVVPDREPGVERAAAQLKHARTVLRGGEAVEDVLVDRVRAEPGRGRVRRVEREVRHFVDRHRRLARVVARRAGEARALFPFEPRGTGIERVAIAFGQGRFADAVEAARSGDAAAGRIQIDTERILREPQRLRAIQDGDVVGADARAVVAAGTPRRRTAVTRAGDADGRIPVALIAVISVAADLDHVDVVDLVAVLLRPASAGEHGGDGVTGRRQEDVRLRAVTIQNCNVIEHENAVHEDVQRIAVPAVAVAVPQRDGVLARSRADKARVAVLAFPPRSADCITVSLDAGEQADQIGVAAGPGRSARRIQIDTEHALGKPAARGETDEILNIVITKARVVVAAGSVGRDVHAFEAQRAIVQGVGQRGAVPLERVAIETIAAHPHEPAVRRADDAGALDRNPAGGQAADRRGQNREVLVRWVAGVKLARRTSEHGNGLAVLHGTGHAPDVIPELDQEVHRVFGIAIGPASTPREIQAPEVDLLDVSAHGGEVLVHLVLLGRSQVRGGRAPRGGALV